MEFTSDREGDSPVLPDLLDQNPEDEEIGIVTGDDAFDPRRCHAAILTRGGTAVSRNLHPHRFMNCFNALGAAEIERVALRLSLGLEPFPLVLKYQSLHFSL